MVIEIAPAASLRHSRRGDQICGGMKSLKGHLILDNGKLAGSWFHRTVVLICQHDAEGAFGLVLNRSSGTTLGDAVVANLPSQLKAQPLFIGGPVQPTALSFLHSDDFLPDANVLPNLNLDHSIDTLIEIGDSFSATQKTKVFAGYAGWSAGQLDDELKRDCWLTHPASIELVFNVGSDHLWQKILREKGGRWHLLADAPEDLSRN